LICELEAAIEGIDLFVYERVEINTIYWLSMTERRNKVVVPGKYWSTGLNGMPFAIESPSLISVSLEEDFSPLSQLQSRIF
jgi:hypothetical protein